MHIEEVRNILERLDVLDAQCQVGVGRVKKINADIAEADDEDVIDDLQEQRERALMFLQSLLTQMEVLFREVGIEP
ncbi:MAG: hypothetical protein LKI21_00300 [Bifidobacterium crudilactis]|jgi:hypothetical protein|nr:hypothetical protein [Bifidobacterium crudilactis]